jgi:hypothetical protein
MLDHIAHVLLQVLNLLAGLVFGVLAFFEDGLAHAMTQMGLPHPVQTVLAVFLALLILVAAFRLFGGFIRVVVIVVVLAIVVHAVTHHGYDTRSITHI